MVQALRGVKVSERPHRRKKKHSKDEEAPVMSGDFCFMGSHDHDRSSPIFVVRDHDTRMTFAHMV